MFNFCHVFLRCRSIRIVMWRHARVLLLCTLVLVGCQSSFTDMSWEGIQTAILTDPSIADQDVNFTMLLLDIT